MKNDWNKDIIYDNKTVGHIFIYWEFTENLSFLVNSQLFLLYQIIFFFFFQYKDLANTFVDYLISMVN